MKKDLKSELKVEVESLDKEIYKEHFVEMLAKNPDQLKRLSLDRLMRIIKYYEKKIETIKKENKN